MKRLWWVVLLPVLVYGVLGLAVPDMVTAWGLQLERSRCGLQHKTVQVDAETWHYLEGGRGHGNSILMLHGFSADKDNWVRFACSITPDYHVVIPDLPGFGESARYPDWDYRQSVQQARLARFTQALGMRRLHLVGNSMGGQIAVLYTRARPQQVISLALFNNGGVAAPQPSEATLAMASGRNPLLLESIDQFEEQLRWVSHVEPFLPWPVKGGIARIRARQAAFNALIFRQIEADRRGGLETALSEIRQPVLILWGRLDRIVHVSSVEVMRTLIPQAEVIIMEQTGHIPMVERPALSAEHYLAFIEKHDG